MRETHKQYLLDASSFDSIVHLLQWRACYQPERLAYTFLSSGKEVDEHSLTYAALDTRARAIAALLQGLVQPDTRVLLLYPPGLEYIAAFLGCLYAGVVAVPAYPPQSKRFMSRLQTIVTDTNATIALTTSKYLSSSKRLHLSDVSGLESLQWISTSDVASEMKDQWRDPGVTSETLAFLQYTSGSTATPRGVMLSHGNLLHNLAMIHRGFEQTPDSRGVIWLPPYHDMGLIGGILEPLYAGFPVTLLAPTSFLQQPFLWLQTISRTGATSSGGPNFAYDLCTRKITPDQRKQLDLRSWNLAFCGAEPIRLETLERFAATFGPCGFNDKAFYSCYGLAEATLIVSGGDSNAPPVTYAFQKSALERRQVVRKQSDGKDAQTLVSCGHILGKQHVAIVDPLSFRSCSEAEIGEIWISGPSVAQGYWRNPEGTRTTFGSHLANTGEGPFLRTGDLGFIYNGELFVTGRLKDVLIIRGLNHYPQDIEFSMERSHPALLSAGSAAFSVEVAGEERLVVIQEVGRHHLIEVESIFENIHQAIAEQHEIAAYAIVLVKQGSIPKTSSGKIQRQLCKRKFLEGSLDVEAEWHEITTQEAIEQEVIATRPFEQKADPSMSLPDRSSLEKQILSYVASRLKVQARTIDIHRSLTLYGIDSLTAIELKNDIENFTGMNLPLTSILDGVSVARLSELVSAQLAPSSARASFPTIPTLQVAEYKLSYGQQALWFLNQLAPDSAAYNIAYALRLQGKLDVSALKRALTTIVQRHPSLRTIFPVLEGKPFQRIQQPGEIFLQEEDASNWDLTSLKQRLTLAANLPFNLEQGPLLRLYLFKRSAQEHILLLVIHHIISDLWSLALLLHEFKELYIAEKNSSPVQLTHLSHQYLDYVSWQEQWLQSSEAERAGEFWQRYLGTGVAALDFFTGKNRPPVQTYQGAVCRQRLGTDLVSKIKSLVEAQGVTLYMFLLATLQVLLYRYTGQEDFFIGSPTSGRNSAGVSGIVGYFVNPIVLRADLSQNPTFVALLDRVRNSVLKALEHQDYPFAQLVEQLQPARDISRSPLFQVMFGLQKAPTLDNFDAAPLIFGDATSRVNWGNLSVEYVEMEHQKAQFDLALFVAEVGDELLASLEYNTDIFDGSMAEQLLHHWLMLVELVIAHPEELISEFEILSQEERRQLLQEWNATQQTYPQQQCLHALFEEQVERTPEAIALVYEQEYLSYAALNRYANQLAHCLRARGVGPEVRVGVCLERSLDLVIALLGVLKAGGAYVPLDPRYPQQRLTYMLTDAQVPVLLTRTSVHAQLSHPDIVTICLDTFWDMEREEPTTNPHLIVQPDHLAYVIYTSGSTGKPKGAMNRHRSVVNRLHWMQQQCPLMMHDSVMQKTPFSFDVSVWEFFWPLLNGVRLVMARPEGHRDTHYLASLIADQQVTAMHFVPSMLQAFLTETRLEEHCRSLKHVFCSGEALSFELQTRFFARFPRVALYNLYGPTEAAIEVTYWECQQDSQHAMVPIGRPIANTCVYVLDEHGHPQPLRVPGELYLGGVGLARGYLHQPDLTAERFVPDPFSGQPGARLYRTGDRVCWRSDGTLEFLGRLDQQIKLRGYRIEPAEIESALRELPAVRECVVLAYQEPGQHEPRLVAYVVAHAAEQEELSSSQLRAALSARLPDYMVPSAFVWLSSIPLTPNGKLDRRALPAPERQSSQSYVPARTPTEEMLSAIWCEVLQVEQVGIYDNFFELGGHSLLATQVMARVRQAFQCELPLRTLFEAPCVAEISILIDTVKNNKTQPSLSAIVPIPRDTHRVKLSSLVLDHQLFGSEQERTI